MTVDSIEPTGYSNQGTVRNRLVFQDDLLERRKSLNLKEQMCKVVTSGEYNEINIRIERIVIANGYYVVAV